MIDKIVSVIRRYYPRATPSTFIIDIADAKPNISYEDIVLDIANIILRELYGNNTRAVLHTIEGLGKYELAIVRDGNIIDYVTVHLGEKLSELIEDLSGINE